MDITVWLKENTSWISVAKDVGIFSIAAFFLQKIVNNSADKKLEKYKQELDFLTRRHQLSLDTELEKFKGNITLHLNRQNSLHERHLDIIDKMYKNLVELDSAMREMMARIKPIYEDAEREDEARISRAQNAFKEYNNYFLLNKLYFNEEISSLLEQIQKDYYSANFDYFEPKRLSAFTGGRPTSAGYSHALSTAQNASERVINEIPKTLKMLEVEFRKILGVN